MEKQCIKCNETKNINEFIFQKTRNKHMNVCHECFKYQRRLFRKNNQDIMKLRDKRERELNKKFKCVVCEKPIDSRGKTGKCIQCALFKEGAGLGALHAWIKKRFPKKELCQCCNIVKPIDLANKGVYDRNLENWEWLCRKCHMTKDGRMNNLKDFNDKAILNHLNNGLPRKSSSQKLKYMKKYSEEVRNGTRIQRASLLS